eukprot:Platyproteum_vivax@DN2426_c0_g1_i2.p1
MPEVPDRIKFYCRVASLSGKDRLPSSVNVVIGNSETNTRLTGVGMVDLGGGIRCMAFRPHQPESTLIFSFSYFEDTNPVLYLSTGLSLILTSGFIDNINSFFFQKANQFFWHKDFQEILSNNVVENYVFCGFSLGGGVAHAIAYLFDTEEWKPEEQTEPTPKTKIHVYGFGNARVGNEQYREWYFSRVEKDSCSVVVGKREDDGVWLDPVTTQPPFNEGYCNNPSGYMLTEEDWLPLDHADGLVCFTERQESSLAVWPVLKNLLWSRSIFNSKNKQLYNDLHSVLKYYELLMAC